MKEHTMTHPFPNEALILDANGPTEEFMHQTANQFRLVIGNGVFWSLGAEKLMAVPGVHQLGALTFTARILPMKSDGTRAERPRLMAVMISLTGRDSIDIEVREFANGRTHARIEDIYIDQLAQAILALDYNGDEVLNPRYWSAN